MGSTSGRKWIHNPQTQEQKMINPEDLPKYLSEGWVTGRARSGRKYIYNTSVQKQKKVNPEDLPKYLSEGWVLGRSPKDKEHLSKATLGKKYIHNPSTQEQKMINKEDLPKYLSEGWVTGRSPKDKENLSKGQQELHADPERAEAMKRKRYDTKKKNGTFNTSEPEEKLYEILVKQNPGKTVLCQYREERYPFSCDFYIVEDDLFIELNGSWRHGYHPYNPEDTEDQKTLEKWREKAKTSDSYDNAIYVWTDLDVRKQKTAKENNLNYRMIYPDEYKKIVKQCA